MLVISPSFLASSAREESKSGASPFVKTGIPEKSTMKLASVISSTLSCREWPSVLLNIGDCDTCDRNRARRPAEPVGGEVGGTEGGGAAAGAAIMNSVLLPGSPRKG